MTPNMLYITAKDKAEACLLAESLLQERLIACANIFDPITSLYWWQGAIQRDQEVVIIAKTQADLVPAVIEKIKALHSYACPCVVAWPLSEGNPAFFDWLAQETLKDHKI